MGKKTDRKESKSEAYWGDPILPETDPEIEPEIESEMIPAPVPVIPEKLPEETKPEGAVISLAVFIQLAGKKPDQVAGFKRWALNQGLKPMTVRQWRGKMVEFDNRPMR